MIQARIKKGRVQPEEPIPREWEGRLVKIVPLTPDDPIPDLEERIAELEAMGPMEWEPGEKEAIEAGLAEMDRISKAEVEASMGIKR